MPRKNSKKVSFEDVFESILSGNDSEVENLSSNEEVDDSDGDSSNDDNSDDNNTDNVESGENGDGADPATQLKQKKSFRWRKKDMPQSDGSFDLKEDDIEEPKSPLEYFRQFWPDEINNLIVEQTNLYSTQKTDTSINTNKKETEQLIRMHLKMCIIQLPSYKLYWSQKMRYPAIADQMPLKRMKTWTMSTSRTCRNLPKLLRDFVNICHPTVVINCSLQLVYNIGLANVVYLKNKGILACGTVRDNRLQGCPLQPNKDLNKAGRGAMDFKSDTESGIIVVKWLDNNIVHIVFNYIGVEPLGSVQRWSPKDRKRMSIQCPQLILRYNKGMGGVDKLTCSSHCTESISRPEGGTSKSFGTLST
ncbi:Hypothetical predicted protein [Paramuricea clavata]|uniref:PiggyBac transposable element-derived protein domain-containing protein n=1 Tax=Paramuricea clavata TaxID=317549 RepID=A0A6S7IKJ5_PARCT|nr:Hypothetical predicted protein [Paramuricea clavata]